MTEESNLLWLPKLEDQRTSPMAKFVDHISKKFKKKFSNYQEFHLWTIQNKESFWTELFPFFDLIFEGVDDPAFTAEAFEAYGWFPYVRLNFAENLLKHRPDENEVMAFVHESGYQESYTYAELKQAVSSLQYAFKDILSAGDVVAAYMPNLPETVMTMLATTSLGGVFTSTSCDFGVEGVVDRFGQCEPKILVAAAAYQYNGKTIDNLEKIQEIMKNLPSVEKVFIVDFLGLHPDIKVVDRSHSFEDAVMAEVDHELKFTRVNFDAPVYIMYSSGTTGKPKCIIHGVGGTLLQHVKELGLHVGLTEKDNLFYFTTCGWMMWNWQVSGLFFNGKITLYEGSPSYPSLLEFFEIINSEKLTIFGTSPKFLKSLEDSLGEEKIPKLPSLRLILSTGAPLLPEQYDFVYTKIKKTVQLSSISGGTDILGCFMLGSPLVPVHRGEIQCLGLGMDVVALDEQGEVVVGAEGELVCRQSFPSRPIAFMNDPHQDRLKEAYFVRYPQYWHHGDFVSITERATVIVFGRSDATLNPGGVRIGTSEIYRQVEKLDFIEDSLCVGKNTQDDALVYLFVKLKDDLFLDEEKIQKIKTHIRENTTPRHIPHSIFQVSDIPYTRNGKKMELAVTRLLAEKELQNLEAVANPESLEQYKKFIS